MKIDIRGVKVTIEKDEKEHIEKKLKKLDKYFYNADDLTAYVVIKERFKKKITEITIPTGRFTLRAEESAKNIYTACNKTIELIERQIRKHKTKLNNTKKKDTRIPSATKTEHNEDILDKVIKRKEIEIHPMDEEEAIIQMELLGHNFFVYQDVNEECFTVLYRRFDGNYGVIYGK